MCTELQTRKESFVLVSNTRATAQVEHRTISSNGKASESSFNSATVFLISGELDLWDSA